MNRKILITGLLFVTTLNGFSQKDTPAYQRFFAAYLTIYKDLAKPPLKNFYEVLSNAARFSFNTADPVFVHALEETAAKNKVSEWDALEILFDRVHTDLKNNYLWVAAPGIYESKKELFQVYYNSLCPCITSEVSNPDMGEKLLEAQKRCNYELTTDTAFFNKLKSVAGGTTLKELYDVANYLSIFMYGNCGILFQRFNNTIKSSTVFEDYISGIRFSKMREGESAIRFARAGQPDSLALVFPGHKTFSNEFAKLLAATGANTVSMRSNFIAKRGNGLPVIYIRFYKKQGDFNAFARAEMTVSDLSVNAKIISLKYQKEKPLKEGQIVTDRVISQ